MQNRRSRSVLLACAVFALSIPATVEAQNNRSFLSALGSDSSNCSVTAPCRMLTTALAATNPGGEIIIIDSAEYGPASITKPVTISATDVVASITQTGVTANALVIDTTGNVTIRGVEFHGGGTGTNGIQINGVGVLRLYNVTVEGFAGSGILFQGSGSLSVQDSRFVDDRGEALSLGMFTSNQKTYVRNCSVDNSGEGVFMWGGAVVVSHSHARSNSLGFRQEGGALVLADDDATWNSGGIYAEGGTVQLSNSVLKFDGYAYDVHNGGTLSETSPGTNVATGLTAGSPSAPAVLQ